MQRILLSFVVLLGCVTIGLSCAPGQYINGAQCYNCAPGSVSDGETTSCTSCTAGTFANVSVCQACETGSVSGDNASNCTACSNGYYSNAAQTACLVCQSGYTSLAAFDSCYLATTISSVPYSDSTSLTSDEYIFWTYTSSDSEVVTFELYVSYGSAWLYTGIDGVNTYYFYNDTQSISGIQSQWPGYPYRTWIFLIIPDAYGVTFTFDLGHSYVGPTTGSADGSTYSYTTYTSGTSYTGGTNSAVNSSAAVTGTIIAIIIPIAVVAFCVAFWVSYSRRRRIRTVRTVVVQKPVQQPPRPQVVAPVVQPTIPPPNYYNPMPGQMPGQPTNVLPPPYYPSDPNMLPPQPIQPVQMPQPTVYRDVS